VSESSHGVSLHQQSGYRFRLDYAAGAPPVITDEPPPLGEGSGPSPLQLLAASVGNCLAASLLFALRKHKQSAEPLSAVVEAQVGRNDQRRLRVQHLSVRLNLGVPAASIAGLSRVLAQFEEFCTVTQSLRAAIPVDVQVFDSEGVRQELSASEAH
jgi:uncharacterized OsmC-like protein